MTEFTFKIEGTSEWYGATIEDGHGTIEPLEFTNGEATHEVPDAPPTWLTVHARGNQGAQIIVSILKGEKPHVKKRTYTIPDDGSIVRAIQFDPKNPTVKEKSDA